jgi:hypothetical protein
VAVAVVETSQRVLKLMKSSRVSSLKSRVGVGSVGAVVLLIRRTCKLKLALCSALRDCNAKSTEIEATE